MKITTLFTLCLALTISLLTSNISSALTQINQAWIDKTDPFQNRSGSAGLDLKIDSVYVLTSNIEVVNNQVCNVRQGASLDCDGYHVEVYSAIVRMNHSEIDGNNPANPPVIWDYEYIFCADVGNLQILNTNFGKPAEDDRAYGRVAIADCAFYRILNCDFQFEQPEDNNEWALALVVNEDFQENLSGAVTGCNFTVYEGGYFARGRALGVTGFHTESQVLVINNNAITSSDVGLDLFNLTGTSANEDQSPIRVFNNNISGIDGHGLGINIWDTVLQKSLLVRNNLIHNCDTGMQIFATWDGGCFPLIYNNSVYSYIKYGISCTFLDQIENKYDGLRIRNNIIFEGLGQEEPLISSIAIYMTSVEGAELNQLDLANNIIDNADYGIIINMLDGEIESFEQEKIDYNGFKGISDDRLILRKVGNQYSNISVEAMGDHCVYHDPDGAGDDERFHGQYIMLAEESGLCPWGIASPNFHILLDNIPGWWDRNDDLANKGNSGENDEWLDPNWGIWQMRAINGVPEVIPGLLPDLGIFGGPYSRFNIDDNFNPQDDQIYYTDGGFYGSDMPMEYYENWVTIGVPIIVPGLGNTWTVAAGTVINFPTGVEIAGEIQVNGGTNNLDVGFLFTNGGYLNFTSSTDVSNSYLNYLHVYNASYGLYLSGVTSSGSDRLEVSNCTFDSCGVGVYANNSRLHLLNTTITGSTGISGSPPVEGNGVYLVNCAAGKVVIDSCSITGNASSATVSGSGVYLSSSSPEITSTLIEHNAGGGIYCYSSTPDLNTYYSSNDHPNSIHSNGASTQSGSDGAEIYLTNSSYPDVGYNNIWDYNSQPIGYMIYKEPSSNASSLTAKFNWWGATPTNSFFYWGSGSSIIYSSYYSSQLSSAELYAAAMEHWDAGEFAECADILENCVFDTGSIGINSIHYLAGCVGETVDGDRQGRLSYQGLREFLQGVASDQQDEDVAKVAQRFATDCLTEEGEYEAAMEEYDNAITNAGCLEDSVSAVIDWLSVYELANGHVINAAGKSVPEMMGETFAALNRKDNSKLVPEEFSIESAYPNPFNATMRIEFGLDKSAPTQLRVYDLQGRLVEVLVNGRLPAGKHSVVWNGADLPAGVYLLRLESSGTTSVVKAAIIK